MKEHMITAQSGFWLNTVRTSGQFRTLSNSFFGRGVCQRVRTYCVPSGQLSGTILRLFHPPSTRPVRSSVVALRRTLWVSRTQMRVSRVTEWGKHKLGEYLPRSIVVSIYVLANVINK